MLLTARSYGELSFRDLMDVYEESNRENAQELWPQLSEGEGILRVEQVFYRYLREVFFPVAGAVYCIWTEKECYISALRLEPYRDGLLVEALETAPPFRRRGYAVRLLRAAQQLTGAQKLYSHVGKRNTASLQTHLRCGFRRVSEQAVYVDGSVNGYCCTLLYDGDR